MAARRRVAERVAETRGELIAAARCVFERRGFGGASVAEIADEAGFTTGALYWHFKSKEELFLAVYEERAAARAREVLDAAGPVERAPADRARAVADQWMERLRDDPEGFPLTLEFALHSRGRPELSRAFADRLAAVRQAVARELEQAARQRGLELPLSPDRLATVIRALGIGLAFERLHDPDAVPDDLFGEFVAAFFDSLDRQGVPG